MILAYFTVSYDLLRNKDYQRIIDELKRLEATKVLLSMWFVELDNTAQQVKDHLAGFLDDDDRLVVVEFSKKPAYTRALEGTNAWVNARF